MHVIIHDIVIRGMYYLLYWIKITNARSSLIEPYNNTMSCTTDSIIQGSIESKGPHLLKGYDWAQHVYGHRIGNNALGKTPGFLSNLWFFYQKEILLTTITRERKLKRKYTVVRMLSAHLFGIDRLVRVLQRYCCLRALWCAWYRVVVRKINLTWFSRSSINLFRRKYAQTHNCHETRHLTAVPLGGQCTSRRAEYWFSKPSFKLVIAWNPAQLQLWPRDNTLNLPADFVTCFSWLLWLPRPPQPNASAVTISWRAIAQSASRTPDQMVRLTQIRSNVLIKANLSLISRVKTSL